MKVAILGGGLTGVTLARLLAARGHEVVVVEKEDRIGGLCRSWTVDGYTFDTGGSHIIFSRDGEVLRFMQDVLGQNKEERTRNTKIFYKGRYVKYPFENGLADLPKDDLFFCLSEYIATIIRHEKGEIPPPRNFHEWMLGTFGKGITECYLRPYNEKIWNYPPGRMSCHWVEGRVPRPPVDDVIRSAIGIETEGYTHQAVFTYPIDGGIEALVHAIALPVRDRIITGAEVRSLERDGDGWIVHAGEAAIRADWCISTIPAPLLVSILPGSPAHVRRAAAALRYNSLISVFLGVSCPVPPYSWVYLPGPEAGLSNRISFPSGYSTHVAPEGMHAILAEITYNDGDDVATMDDRDIVRHVIDSLSSMGVIRPGDVLSSGIARHRFAYVVYDLDWQQNISIVRDFCRRQGISLVGRFAEFEYLNMDGCIRSALDFAGRFP